MNPEIFVQNIKKRCKALGIKPTIACQEAGVGKSFINNIEAQGSSPSIDRVEKLAAYLGCTVSDLLGETPSPAGLPSPGGRCPEGADEGPPSPAGPADDPIIQEIMSRVRDLTPDQQRLYLAQLRALEAEEKK